jgi:hypothetical protein
MAEFDFDYKPRKAVIGNEEQTLIGNEIQTLSVPIEFLAAMWESAHNNLKKQTGSGKNTYRMKTGKTWKIPNKKPNKKPQPKICN